MEKAYKVTLRITKGVLTLKQLPILLYETAKENIYVDVYFKDETFWMSQKMMADLFEVGVPAISKHLQNIYAEEELELSSCLLYTSPSPRD